MKQTIKFRGKVIKMGDKRFVNVPKTFFDYFELGTEVEVFKKSSKNEYSR